jgi:transcription antitermination factor NusG
MLKLSDNPAARWPIGRPLQDDLGNWWVVRVKPRAEKVLAWQLAEKGIGYYLPMFTKRTLRRDNHKTRKSVLCLFPGYISINNYPQVKDLILRTGKIIRVISVFDQEKFVRELENIRRALDQARELELHPQLAVGERVVIADGPMQGVEGVIEDIKNPEKIFLNVEMFNRAVAITIKADLLMPVHGFSLPAKAGQDKHRNAGLAI